MKARTRLIWRHLSLWTTLKANLKLFPFKTAIKFPLLCGKHCDLGGLRKGAIVFTEPPRFGMMVWDIMPYPRFSTKGLWTMVRFSKKGVLTCGAGFILRPGAGLFVAGKMTCGRDFLVNQRALVVCQQEINAGDHVRIGWDAQVLDSDCHLLYNENKNQILFPHRAITIGRNVWIASRVNVGKGAVIPDYSIVARGALINKDFSDVTTRGNVFAGVPAALKGTGVYRLLDIDLERRVAREFGDTGRHSATPEELGVSIEKALNPEPHTGV